MLKLNKIFCSQKIGLMLLIAGTTYSPAVMAQSSEARLGVVLSRENIKQWEQISSRLNNSSVNYCILDSRDWQNPEDLQSLNVLFLPNVNNINSSQANALKVWVKNGGKVIASGPTGESSSGEVKNTLRDVLGAYWSFPLSQSSSLTLNSSETNGNVLASSSLRGGVIVPTRSGVTTRASWSMSGNPPAVVSSNNATFL